MMLTTARVALRLLLTALLASVSHFTFSVPTLEDYGELPSTQMLSISPSGKYVAFRRNVDAEDYVVIYSLEKSEVINGLDVSSILPHNIYFASDDELILVVSRLQRIDGFRGEHDISTAWVFDIQTGENKRLLTPSDNIYLGQTDVGRITGISKDKRYLFMPAYVGRSDLDKDPDLYLMKVDIKSPSKPKIHQRGHPKAIDYFTDIDGNVVAQEVYSNKLNSHKVLSLVDNQWQEIFSDNAEVRQVDFAGITPDQKSLVMLKNNPIIGRTSYSALSLKDGAITENILSRKDADIEQIISGIGRVAYGVIYSGLHPSYKFFDEKINTRMQSIIDQFPEQSVWLRGWSDDWQHLVVYVDGSQSSGNFYLCSTGQKPRFLSAARPNIQPEDVNPIGWVNINARDGLVIPTLLTIPTQYLSHMKNLPAIVLPHGGPQAYDRIEFDWLAQAISNRGYLVIQPQFRGSAGYGSAHLHAGHGQWGLKMQDDLTDTLDFLIAKGMVDKERVCTVGGSYGGYAALAAGAFTPDRYRCIVSLNGVSDLNDMLAFERKRHGRNHWIVSYFENFMVEGEATSKKLAALSPVNFAKNFQAPVLLIHGENDETVPFEQSDDMYDALKSARKPVQLIELENENHHLMTGSNRAHALRSIVEFIDQHIGKKSENAS